MASRTEHAGNHTNQKLQHQDRPSHHARTKPVKARKRVDFPICHIKNSVTWLGVWLQAMGFVVGDGGGGGEWW